jgi:ribonuclease HI
MVYGQNDRQNTGFRIPSTWKQTSLVAEIAATLEAVKAADQEAELTIVSPNDFVSKAMTKKLARWENEGWVGVSHSVLLKCLAAELKARRTHTTFVVAPQVSEAKSLCREAAELARREAGSNRVRQINLTVPAGMNLTGIPLQGNKQRTFYRGIREIKSQTMEIRPSTKEKLNDVRESLKHLRNRVFTDVEIWGSIRNKDFSARTAQFLWKAMHNAHRVGNYWKHIPECGDRAVCQTCGEEENLEHILIKCRSPGPEIIWKAAEKLWRGKGPNWPEISIGSILGCGLMHFEDERGKEKPGTRRLYRILVSESAYTIWKLRCDRVISRAGTPMTEKEIINRWISDLNLRLKQDVILANRPVGRNRPRLDPALVYDTWAGTLDNEGSLPVNWLKEPRVLVGRRALTESQIRYRSSVGIG